MATKEVTTGASSSNSITPTKSHLFKRAWQLARWNAHNQAAKRIPEFLKMAWAELKAGDLECWELVPKTDLERRRERLQATIILMEQTSGFDPTRKS